MPDFMKKEAEELVQELHGIWESGRDLDFPDERYKAAQQALKKAYREALDDAIAAVKSHRFKFAAMGYSDNVSAEVVEILSRLKEQS